MNSCRAVAAGGLKLPFAPPAAAWTLGAQADMGSYMWKWIPLEQVIFITAPFRLVSVISLITPSAISGGLQRHTQMPTLQID